MLFTDPFNLPQPIVGNVPFRDPLNAPPWGLIAVGGDLSPSRLIEAYAKGIFPWFNDDREAILWWSPDPRCVLPVDKFHVSRSLAKWCKRHELIATVDQDFETVIQNCAMPREKRWSTWITSAMQSAYGELHRLGYAHSLEIWLEGELVGGIYGVALGRHFYGESMFSNQTNGSKVALMMLCRLLFDWNYELIDCQLQSPHLESLGAVTIDREKFLSRVSSNRTHFLPLPRWQIEPTRCLAD